MAKVKKSLKTDLTELTEKIGEAEGLANQIWESLTEKEQSSRLGEEMEEVVAGLAELGQKVDQYTGEDAELGVSENA